jgi:isoaspartyl peptidase/L-asparaginase-like protein (Ntn-hydrolase superfamily)
MAAPTNTYDSNTDLSLGAVPQVDDPELYIALLDIHNAIETLLTGSDDGDAVFEAYIAKQRSVITVTGDYTVTTLDGTVRVDASTGDITVTLFAVSGFLGYKQYIKRVDEVFANKVTLVGDGLELVDDRADGINISTKSSYSVKSNLTGWDIV